jgi:hypothetical protein
MISVDLWSLLRLFGVDNFQTERVLGECSTVVLLLTFE